MCTERLEKGRTFTKDVIWSNVSVIICLPSPAFTAELRISGHGPRKLQRIPLTEERVDIEAIGEDLSLVSTNDPP